MINFIYDIIKKRTRRGRKCSNMKRFVFAVMVFVLMLCGCTAKESQGKNIVKSVASQLEVPENTEYEFDEVLLIDGYVDISKLPVLDLDIEKTFKADDRVLEIEDFIDNQLELTVYDLYHNIVFGDYDSIMNMIGENESLKTAFQNESKDFNDGNYMKEYIMHEINTLTVDDIKNLNEYSKKWIYELITECNIEKYAVVELDLTFKHNEKSLSMSPQLADGRYKRYYVLGKVPESDSYKIYEVYWDIFLS